MNKLVFKVIRSQDYSFDKLQAIESQRPRLSHYGQISNDMWDGMENSR